MDWGCTLRDAGGQSDHVPLLPNQKGFAGREILPRKGLWQNSAAPRERVMPAGVYALNMAAFLELFPSSSEIQLWDRTQSRVKHTSSHSQGLLIRSVGSMAGLRLKQNGVSGVSVDRVTAQSS